MLVVTYWDLVDLEILATGEIRRGVRREIAGFPGVSNDGRWRRLT